MKISLHSSLRNFLVFIAVGALISTSQSVKADTQSVQAAVTDTACRFGITSPAGSEGYDIGSLGVGSYLDWGATTNPSLPEGVEYIRVLRLRDDLYPGTLANITGWVEAFPGGVWLVGNEPDTRYGEQDELEAEVYADRYYELATLIRRGDPTAQIGFGSVVQPTPIRLRYLTKAWNELITQAGSRPAASELIDIWSIHAFILNEINGSWGTGVPPGFEWDHWDEIEIKDYADTYSIDIFQQRVNAMRDLMANIGERNKPLWITEYGSLFPPIDPPGGPDYENVSDEDTAAYMVETFNYMLSAANDQSGLPGDGNQLVQRWYWYSLNEHRYTFGGTIYDPDNGNLPTWVGEKFIEYQAENLVQLDLFPASLSITPISFNPERTLGNYRVNLAIGNKIFADASCAQVWLYDGDPDAGGILIAGPIPSSVIKSAYGNGVLSIPWNDVLPLTPHTLFVQVDSIGVTDTDPSNNRASFPVFTGLPELVYLPAIRH